jgi:hypothetical protein
MAKMLQWDPAARITPEEAKYHPWILELENSHTLDGHSPRGMTQNDLKRKTSAVSSALRANRGPLTEAGNVQHALTFANEASTRSFGMQQGQPSLHY